MLWMTMYARKELAPRPRMHGGPAGTCRSVDLPSSFACICADWLRNQEFKDRSLRRLGLIGREQMAGVFEQDELCAGNPRRDQFPIGRRDQAVGLSVNYERGSRDPGQAGERFPRKDRLQLSKIAGRAGRPGETRSDIFID